MSVGPEVVPFDLHRMFLGDTPPLFLLEVVFRTVVIFLWLLFLLRLTGKRGLAQLSPLEFAIVVALGSAAGDPMFYPEVPLLHAMLTLAVVVGLQRLLAQLIIRNETVETLLDGKPVELVRSGVIDREALAGANMSLEDLLERLRPQGVRQLGQVQRAYMEQDGVLSVFKHEQDAPAGLPITPPWDLNKPRTLPAGAVAEQPVACLCCGRTRPGRQVPGQCACGENTWTPALTDPLADQD